MRTTGIVAMAAIAVMAFACKEPSYYEKMVREVKNDKEVKALMPSAARMDSVSYLLGVNYGLMLKGQGFFDKMSEINMDELKRGIEDALEAGLPKHGHNSYVPCEDTLWTKEFKISPYKITDILQNYMKERFAYKAKFNEVLGKKYLAANKSKEGVKETENGIQYVVHTEGEGELIAENDTLTIRYVGTFIDGTEFDTRDSLIFSLSKSRNPRTGMLSYPVVDGYAEGLRLLNKGAKATFYIPGEHAYSTTQVPGIQPNSTLIYEVEVLDVKKYHEPVTAEEVSE